MGNGASSKKSENSQKKEDFEEEDDEDFDSYARKKAQERSGQQRLEQAGLLPKLESSPERSKPVVRETIIGLDDSDDDEGETPNNEYISNSSFYFSSISYKTKKTYKYEIQTA